MRRVTIIKPWITANDIKRKITLTEFDFINVPWLDLLPTYPIYELIWMNITPDSNPDNVKMILDSSHRVHKERIKAGN